MNLPEVEELYKTNEEFKEYVDKYMKNRNTTHDVVIKHKIVHNVAKYYKEKK